MALTSTVLLVVSIIAAIGALAGTVWVWRRGSWWQVPVRTLGVLLCEALILFVGGLVLNRALDLYPSWTALIHQNDPDKGAQASATQQPALDGGTDLGIFLKAHAADGARNGLVFDWKPAEWTDWHLAAAPSVYLPPAYFTNDTTRFPVVVVTARAKATPAQAGWDGKNLITTVRGATPPSGAAIGVFLRMDKPDSGQLLTKLLPDRLATDLRVVEHGWGLITVGVDAPLGLSTLTAKPDRYGCAVLVSDAAGELPRTLLAGHHTRVSRPVLIVEGPGAPSGTPRPDPTGIPGFEGLTVTVVPQLTQRLTAALRLVYPLLAAPLAAPLVGPQGPLPPAPTPKTKR